MGHHHHYIIIYISSVSEQVFIITAEMKEAQRLGRALKQDSWMKSKMTSRRAAGAMTYNVRT